LKSRILGVVTMVAVVGVAAGVVSFVIQSQANKTRTQAEQLTTVLNAEATPAAPTLTGTSKTGPTLERIQGFLDGQNLVSNLDQLGTEPQKATAARQAAEFVSPELASNTEAVTGLTPLSGAVSVASGAIKFTADPDCVWTAPPPLPQGQTDSPQPTTLIRCLGADDQIYGWAELTWTGEGAAALIQAINVGWSSAHLREVKGS
jgi:hypothetical protein